MNNLNRKKDLLLLPLIFFLTLYPMIIRLYVYDPILERYDWFDYSTAKTDLFLAWKMYAMEIIGGLMCLILLYHIVKYRPKIKWNQILFLLLGYAGLTFVSTMFSDYAEFGFKGIYAQFEPVWCTLIYILIVFYIYILIERTEQIRILL